MASKSLLCVLITMISLVSMNAASPVALRPAKEFKVGGDLGWLEPPSTNATFYNLWATANRFRIGDSLVFEYNNDSVVVVEKWGYYHCEAREAMIGFDDGNSTVKLDRAGLFYFISGAPLHCKRGQRMIVDVMSPRGPPPDGSPLPAQSSVSGPSRLATCRGSCWFFVLLVVAILV